jgi:HAD superfamily phosphoserine phosphatase-like hydrolase
LKAGLVICDLDGTLLSCSTEKELVRLMLRKRTLPAGNALRFIIAYLLHPAKTVREGKGWNREYLRGLSPKVVHESAELLLPVLKAAIVPEVAAILGEAVSGGARLYLVSASLEPLVSRIASLIGFHGFVGSVPEERGGRFTGGIRGPRPWGKAKADIGRSLMADEGVHPENTLALGDSVSDTHLMSECGQAIAVRPGRRMMRMAERNGWRVLK